MSVPRTLWVIFECLDVLEFVKTLLEYLWFKYFFYVVATHDAETTNDEENKKVPYPKQIFCIVSMEACERFSFYGMNSKSVYKHFYTSLPF